jgi:hypothetical protein
VPEVVEAALALPVTTVVLDGEAIALKPDGRPQPFQVTASRVGSRGDPAALRAATPLSPVLFDLLHLDGADLLDAPGSERAAAMAKVVPESVRVPRVVAGAVAGGVGGVRGGARPRARGRGGQVAVHAVRGRTARGRLAEGEAEAHARPGGARGRAGHGGGPAGCRTCTWGRGIRPAGS